MVTPPLSPERLLALYSHAITGTVEAIARTPLPPHLGMTIARVAVTLEVTRVRQGSCTVGQRLTFGGTTLLHDAAGFIGASPETLPATLAVGDRVEVHLEERGGRLSVPDLSALRVTSAAKGESVAADLAHALTQDAVYAGAVARWVIARSAPWRPRSPLRSPSSPETHIVPDEHPRDGGWGTIAPHRCWRCGGDSVFEAWRDSRTCDWCDVLGDEPIDRVTRYCPSTGSTELSRNHCLTLINAAAAMLGGSTRRIGDDRLAVVAPPFNDWSVAVGFDPSSTRDGRRRVIIDGPPGLGGARTGFARLIDALFALMEPLDLTDRTRHAFMAPLVFTIGER